MPWRVIFLSMVLLAFVPGGWLVAAPQDAGEADAAASVERLARVLDSPAATLDEKIQACRDLTAMGTDAAGAIPALVGALARPDPLRTCARKTLSVIGPAAIPALAAAMHVAPPDAFAAMGEAWAAIDEASKVPAKTLTDRLIHGTVIERYEAARALAVSQRPAEVLAALLAARDQDESALVRNAADDALKQVNWELTHDLFARRHWEDMQSRDRMPLGELAQAVSEGSEDEQIAELQKLARYGGVATDEAGWAVRALLDSPSAEVARAAAVTLMAMKSAGREPWLDALESRDGFTRRLAVEALSEPTLVDILRSGWNPNPDAVLVARLIHLLDDPDPLIRRPAAAAACTLGRAASSPLLYAMQHDAAVCEGVVDQLLARPALFDFERDRLPRMISVAGQIVNADALNEMYHEFEEAIAPTLIARLRSHDPRVLAQAVAACDRMRSRAFMRQLTEFATANHGNWPPTVHEMAAARLAMLGPDGLTHLAQGARSDDEYLRRICVKTLADLPDAAANEDARAAMAAALSDPADDVRKIALRWASDLPTPPAELAAPLAGILRDAQPARTYSNADRLTAMTLLGRIASRPDIGVPLLLAALDDPDPPMRRLAAEALRGFGDDARVAVPRLGKALQEQGWPEGLPTAQTLADLGPEGRRLAGAFIVDAVRKDPACLTGPTVLSIITRAGPAAAGTAPALENLLSSDNNAQRIVVANALANFGPAARSALPALTRMVDNRDGDIRQAASLALVKIAPDGKGLAPALLAAVLNADRPAASRMAAACRHGDDVKKLRARLNDIAGDDPNPGVRNTARRAMEMLGE